MNIEKIKKTVELINALKMLDCISPTGGARECIADSMVGKYVIVRTRGAGVHCGTLTAVSGTECNLIEARRLWGWSGAFTLNTVAIDGPESAKMPPPVEEIYLPDVIEIIPTSSVAETKLKGIANHVG